MSCKLINQFFCHSNNNLKSLHFQTTPVESKFVRILIAVFFVFFLSSVSQKLYSQYWSITATPNLNIYNNNYTNDGYVGIGTGNLNSGREPSTKLHLFMPVSLPTLHSRLSVLLEQEANEDKCPSFGELGIVNNSTLGYYSSISSLRDVVLRAYGDCSEDLILTTRNANGRLRFATTPTLPVPQKDVERLTIKSNGQVGIGTALNYLPNLESYIIGALDINLDYGGSQPPNIEPQKNHHPKIVFIDPKDASQNYLNTPQIRFYKWQATGLMMDLIMHIHGILKKTLFLVQMVMVQWVL